MNRKTLIALTIALSAPLGASADTSYSFSTDPQSVASGAVSGAITVSGTAPAAQTTCLLLSSSSGTGQFSSSATNWSPVSAVSMSKGSSNRTFYYQDSTSGSYTLTVRVAPKPDTVSSSCTSWSDAGSAVVATLSQSVTVGSGGSQQTSTQTQQDQSSSNAPVAPQTQTAQTSGGVAAPAIMARITTDSQAVVGAGTSFDGSAQSASGAPLSGARYMWNFGDGGTAEGAHVLHTYAYPGTYDVMLSVAYNYSSATARLALEAVDAKISLVAEGDGSLTLWDLGGADIDVGWWRLAQGTSTFTMPEGTEVLAGKGVRFSPLALRFAGDETAALYYPNGTLATAAKVGANSPLRGQVIEPAPVRVAGAPATSPVVAKVVAKTAKAASAPATSTLNGTDQAAAAGAAPFNIEWMYYLGLFAVIAIGAVGSYYAYIPLPRPDSETGDLADEFEIE